MLAYAANTRPLGRAESPKALALIVAGHALLLGALFMTRVDIVPRDDNPIDVILVRNPPKPPPPKPVDEPDTPTRPVTSTLDKPIVVVPRPTPDFAEEPRIAEFHPNIGDAIDLPYVPQFVPKADPVRVAARFATPDNLLRPAYPTSKLRAEEEASLRLRLSIDPRGRVVAVDPVGSADPEFLAAARRHILKAWRYKPATEDGTALVSIVGSTLNFRLYQV